MRDTGFDFDETLSAQCTLPTGLLCVNGIVWFFQFLFQIAVNLKECQDGEFHLVRLRHFQSHEVRIGVKPVQLKRFKKNAFDDGQWTL